MRNQTSRAGGSAHDRPNGNQQRQQKRQGGLDCHRHREVEPHAIRIRFASNWRRSRRSCVHPQARKCKTQAALRSARSSATTRLRENAITPECIWLPEDSARVQRPRCVTETVEGPQQADTDESDDRQRKDRARPGEERAIFVPASTQSFQKRQQRNSWRGRNPVCLAAKARPVPTPTNTSCDGLGCFPYRQNA